MKATRKILVVAAGLMMLWVTASTARPALPPADEKRTAGELPEQQVKGLLATAYFKHTAHPGIFTHTLDLKLTNREDIPKMNVTIERVTLGGYMTYFAPPPTVTLWTKGLSMDYPAIANWMIQPGARGRAPLDVMVRYEDPTGKEVIANFHWEVVVDFYDVAGR